MPPTMERALRRVRETAARAGEADKAATKATRERDAAIVAAWRAGATIRACADAAGISYQRVAQIVRRA